MFLFQRCAAGAGYFVAFYCIASGASATSTFGGDVWLDHLNDDLLGYWDEVITSDAAQGGDFPGRLCNDGSFPVSGETCSGVSARNATNAEQTLVAHSRQVFSYAVGYHMTGDTTYLELAKAGLEYQIATFYDAETGLYNEVLASDASVKTATTDSQKQAYGLLGASFYHYLTGDEGIYEHIDAVSGAIFDGFSIGDGGYARSLTDVDPAESLAVHLDQLNAYMTLLGASVPLADRDGYVAQAYETAQYLIENYYDETTGLLKSAASDEDGAGTDYGHTIKSLWYIDQIAALAGDAELSAFATNAAQDVFELAFQKDTGTWATSQDDAGVQSDKAVWWSHAELTQFATLLSIEDEALREQVAQAQNYWLETFVDDENGGIYASVDLSTGTANEDVSKHHEWKSGFHSFEQALISYLSATQINGEHSVLYYAWQEGTTEFGDLAYGLTSDDYTVLENLTEGGVAVQTVSYANLSYAILPAVPLPAGGLLLLSAVGALFGRGRLSRGTDKRAA